MTRYLLTAVAVLALGTAAGADDKPNLKPPPPDPIPAEKLEAAIARGVKFLLADQNKDGSWGSPSLKGGVPIIAGIGSHHAFGVAVTAMSVSALVGLSTHTFFDGVSIASGFLVSVPLGLLISCAVALHKIPEGFTVASIALVRLLVR